MASITSWTRLEPRARDPKMRAGLAARIRDPLWMISRQWQIGEFRGHDGGSAVNSLLKRESTYLNCFHPGPLKEEEGMSGTPYNPLSTPLEVLAEQELIPLETSKNLSLAVEAGLHFLRLLASRGLGEYRRTILEKYALAGPDEPPPASLDPNSLRLWQAMIGRVPDGSKLYHDLDRSFPLPERSEGGLPPAWGIRDEGLREAAIAWLAWYEQLFDQPAENGSCWVDERLEYQFAVSAPAQEGEHVLLSSEYADGHLDWYSFDYHPGISLGAQKAAPESSSLNVVPAHAASRGMPAARWWQFEDSGSDFGTVEAAPEDLTRLMWMQFALLHAGDWLLIPVDLPVGSLNWIRSLVVTDTFGTETTINPVEDGEPSAPRLFRLTARDSSAPPEAKHREEVLNALFLPPALAHSLHSKPVEEVLFMRDEMANMAWAVEKVVQSSCGKPVNRQEMHDRQQRREMQPPPEVPRTGVSYRLFSQVPSHWIPLLPVRGTDGECSVRLRRGRMQRPQVEEELDGAQGYLLGSEQPLLLYDEQVPPTGVQVSRVFQYSRWVNGSTHLWIGRRKRSGRSQGSSGLSFDIIEPKVKGPATD